MSITTATCKHCYTEKPLTELNGYDPIARDYSNAYCQRLAECNSDASNQTLATLVAALEAA